MTRLFISIWYAGRTNSDDDFREPGCYKLYELLSPQLHEGSLRHTMCINFLHCYASLIKKPTTLSFAAFLPDSCSRVLLWQVTRPLSVTSKANRHPGLVLQLIQQVYQPKQLLDGDNYSPDKDSRVKPRGAMRNTSICCSWLESGGMGKLRKHICMWFPDLTTMEG